MKIYLYNSGLYHICLENNNYISNRYYLIDNYFKCDKCELRIPSILTIGSKLTYLGFEFKNNYQHKLYRIGTIASYDHDYFEKKDLNPEWFELD